jgi:hypothetical protein
MWSIRMPCRVDSAATEFSNEHPRWNDFRNTNGIWLKPKKLFGKPLAELQARDALYSAFYPDNFHTAADGSIVVSEKNGTSLFHLWEENGGRILKGKISEKK